MTVTTSDINNVLVVGSGAMGSQIAMVFALAGLEVDLHDVERDRLVAAETMLRSRLERNVDKDRLSAEARDAAFARLRFVTDLAASAPSVDFVVEAIVEKLEMKRALFEALDRLCPEHTVLSSNSSSFVPSAMASATQRPDRFCNMHFFNPALVMACVEVVRGAETSDATMATVVGLTERIGKEPVVLDKEINGFVANRIVNAIRDEATFLMENGYASIEAIDTACRTALGHPMGPYELQDLTGLDIGFHVREGRFNESGDPKDKPARSLTERFRAGHFGRKSGQGWYRYDDRGNKVEAVAWTPS